MTHRMIRGAVCALFAPLLLAACGGERVSTVTPAPAATATRVSAALANPTAAPTLAPIAMPTVAATAAPTTAPTTASLATTATTATTAPVPATVAPTVAPTAAATMAPPAAATGPTATPRTGSGAAAPTSAAAGPALGSVIARYAFADVPLTMAEPGIVQNDRKIALGGFGSDLWHGANDAPNEFWMVTDRGPNGQIAVGSDNRRTFPVPEFDPAIVQVRLDGDKATIVKLMPIVGQSGKPVTGLSNLDRDEVPYDYAAKEKLATNVNGLDTEGIVRTPDGDFWLCEEYGPSIVHVDAAGKVIERYVPEGLNYAGNDYPVVKNLPAAFGKRRQNRGFEGITLSADGKTLYTVLQSPLSNPDGKTGNASRNTRIIAFDIAGKKPVAEYVYQFSPATEFGAKVTQDALGSSAIRTANATTLIVQERTDDAAKLFLVDISKATNILGTKWDDPTTTPTLESLADPAANQAPPLPKTLLIDLSALPDLPKKIEGVTVLDKSTIVISNDNDFQIGEFDKDGNNEGEASPTRLIVLKLTNPLP